MRRNGHYRCGLVKVEVLYTASIFDTRGGNRLGTLMRYKIRRYHGVMHYSLRLHVQGRSWVRM